MISDFLIPFATIALAEIGDKTQIAMMALAAKHRHTVQIFIGAMAASILVDGSAVAIGGFAAKYIPYTAVSIVAGLLFIGFGMVTLFGKEKEEMPKLSKKAVLAAAFTLFLVSEFGDKSQIAALLFGTQYNLALAFLGTICGIGSLLAVMLAVGKYVSKKIDERKVKMLSAGLFLAIGAYSLIKALAFA